MDPYQRAQESVMSREEVFRDSISPGSLHEGVTFSIHFLIHTGSKLFTSVAPRASALREHQTYAHS